MSEYSFDLLAFAAHPDDAEISCGGLLAKSAKSGYTTAIVDLTQGEMGTRGSIEMRAQESAAASKILGIKYRENLKLPDGAIDRIGQAKDLSGDTSQLAAVVGALRRLRPEVLAIQYPKCRHPDHIAAGELITKAVFFSGLTNYKVKSLSAGENERFTPRQVIYYQTRVDFQPSFVVDISDLYETKVAAIKAYASQLGLDNSKDPGTLLSSPLTFGAIEGRDRYNGALIGCSYGEAYLCLNTVSVGDPVKHFRNTSMHLAQYFKELT